MMELEEIKRKIRIRNEAYTNMIGQVGGYTAVRISEEEVQRILKELSKECQQIDEYACLKIYGEIQARNKLIWVIKKVLRKVCYKCMGWYYVPVIEGQIDFNRQVRKVLDELHRLVQAQQEEIENLKQ